MSLLNKIAKALNLGLKTERLQTDEARVMETGHRLDDHPAYHLDPKKLKSLLEDAERGNIQAQAQLFMDIEEQDSDIGNALQTRKRAMLTLDWTINAPRNATPQEEKITEAVDELFHQIGYLDDLVMDCMDAVGHGFSAIEILWELRQTKWFPAKFIHRPPSWFKLDKFDNLLLITPDNSEGEPLIANKWVVHKHKNRSIQLARNGLFRTLAWLYMFKHYSVLDFAEFLELYGFPIRIGKYGAGATESEKRALLRALADIGHNAAGIMPESMNVELHNVANGANGVNNPYLQMVDWCEKSIARLVLGQTLTSSVDGKTATNALGKIHNEVRRDLLISDARQLEQTITQQVILPYLLFNFPNIDPNRLPSFRFETKEPEDIKTFSEALPALVGAGLPIPTQWVLDKLGIPKADKDEPILYVGDTVKLDETESRKENAPKAAQQAALSGQFSHQGCQCEGCRGVALSATLDNQTPQETLDASLNQALTMPDFNQQLDPMVQKAVAVLMACESYDEAFNALAQAYPELSSEAHQHYLTNALFLADLLGGSDA